MGKQITALKQSHTQRTVKWTLHVTDMEAQFDIREAKKLVADYHSALQVAKMAVSMRTYPLGQRKPSSLVVRVVG